MNIIKEYLCGDYILFEYKIRCYVVYYSMKYYVVYVVRDQSDQQDYSVVQNYIYKYRDQVIVCSI